jgi:hypothetical protein
MMSEPAGMMSEPDDATLAATLSTGRPLSRQARALRMLHNCIGLASLAA